MTAVAILISTMALVLSCSGVFKAIRDTLVHHFDDSIFSDFNRQFWDGRISPANKWKNGDKAQGERFFLSSTLLVGFTDGWHMMGMIQEFLWQFAFATWICVALNQKWYFIMVILFAIKFVYDCSFHFPYTYWFIKKK